MINLLPDETKKDLRAARSNVVLLNYLMILVLGIAFLALICVGVYFILTSTKANAERLISENTSKDTSQGALQAQSTALRQSLNDAKTVLDGEIVYSKFFANLAGLMPAGVVLDNLSISPATFDTATTLQFFAKTNEAALELKSKFEASSFFSDVSLQSLNSNTSGQSANYPVSVSLSLIINKSIAQ